MSKNNYYNKPAKNYEMWRKKEFLDDKERNWCYYGDRIKFTHGKEWVTTEKPVKQNERKNRQRDIPLLVIT